LGGKRDAARAERDHVERGPLGAVGIFLGDFIEPALGGHALDLEADAIGRGLRPDIVQHHLGPARPVEDQARWRDEQVACGMDG
jgi:hypothetical protein